MYQFSIINTRTTWSIDSKEKIRRYCNDAWQDVLMHLQKGALISYDECVEEAIAFEDVLQYGQPC